MVLQSLATGGFARLCGLDVRHWLAGLLCTRQMARQGLYSGQVDGGILNTVIFLSLRWAACLHILHQGRHPLGKGQPILADGICISCPVTLILRCCHHGGNSNACGKERYSLTFVTLLFLKP